MERAAWSLFAAVFLVLVGVIAQQEQAPLWALGAIGAGAGALIYYAFAGVSVLAIFLRALLAFMPVAGLAGGLIFWLIQADILEDAEERALIAAIVVAAGWVVAFVTGEMRQVNQEQERRRDMIRAALEEIDLILEWAKPVEWDKAQTQMRQNFFNDRRYAVFVAYGHQFGTLKRLTDQIEILSQHQIQDVMGFFQLLDRLERMEARMSEATFQNLPWQRRETAVLRYLELQSQVYDTGLKAYNSLNDSPFQGLVRHII